MASPSVRDAALRLRELAGRGASRPEIHAAPDIDARLTEQGAAIDKLTDRIAALSELIEAELASREANAAPWARQVTRVIVTVGVLTLAVAAGAWWADDLRPALDRAIAFTTGAFDR